MLHLVCGAILLAVLLVLVRALTRPVDAVHGARDAVDLAAARAHHDQVTAAYASALVRGDASVIARLGGVEDPEARAFHQAFADAQAAIDAAAHRAGAGAGAAVVAVRSAEQAWQRFERSSAAAR